MFNKQQILEMVAKGAEDTPKPKGLFTKKCPTCQSNLILEEWSWGCEGYDIYWCESCSYRHTIYFWDC